MRDCSTPTLGTRDRPPVFGMERTSAAALPAAGPPYHEDPSEATPATPASTVVYTISHSRRSFPSTTPMTPTGDDAPAKKIDDRNAEEEDEGEADARAVFFLSHAHDDHFWSSPPLWRATTTTPSTMARRRTKGPAPRQARRWEKVDAQTSMRHRKRPKEEEEEEEGRMGGRRRRSTSIEEEDPSHTKGEEAA